MRRWTLAAVPTALALLVPLALAPAPPAPADPAGPPATRAGPASRVSVADGPGSWRVVQVGAGRWRVSWRAPRPLPVGADRPVVAPTVGAGPAVPAEVASGGRLVTAVLSAAAAPDPARLDVLLSGDRLDEPGRDGGAAAGSAGPQRRVVPPATRPATTPAPVDPGVPGPAAVVTSDYALPPVRLPGLPRPVEVAGHVVAPAEPAADAPLVVFLHGRHAWCHDPAAPRRFVPAWPCPSGTVPVPSLRGYDQAQRLLASQGHVTVSIAANGVNAQDGWLPDGGAAARSALVRHHLARWAGWAAEGRPVDLSRVVLVGHSRGGEGVGRAALDTATGAGAADPWSVAGLVLLAPTAFAAQAVPHVPTVTLLAHCDGDVVDLQGQRWTDRARDLAVGDTALHSSLLVMGANHNFFNAEWTPRTSLAASFDDWSGDPDATCGRRHPDRLSAAEQRAVGATYVAAGVRLATGGPSGDPAAAAAVLPLLDGTATRVASAGDADVRAHALGAGRLLLRPHLDAALTPAAGGAVAQLCTGTVGAGGALLRTTCGRDAGFDSAPHWPAADSGVPAVRALELAWAAPGAVSGLTSPTPLDVTGRRWLDLRVVADPARPDARLAVRLTDATGASVEVVPLDDGVVPALPRGDLLLGKHWAQVLRVDLDAPEVTGAGVDLTALRSVELVARSSRGRLWLLDVAAVRDGAAALPAPTATRVPTVSLGSLRVAEGDGDASGGAVAEVPFTVAGSLERPGRFVVVSSDGRRSGLTRVEVAVAAGQSSGVVRWPHRADRVDDLPRQRLHLTAYALDGLVTARHTGVLDVLDDDPTPRITLTPRVASVVEGEALRWVVGVAGPLDYALPVSARPVRAGGTPLRQADLPESWLRERLRLRPALPLHRSWVFLTGHLGSPARATSTVLSLPTRRDGLTEGSETVGLRVRFGGPVDRVVERLGVVRDGVLRRGGGA